MLSIETIKLAILRATSRRVSGRRHSPTPRLLGWFFTAIGCVIALFFLWQLIVATTVPREQAIKGFLVTVAFFTALALYYFNIDRRLRAAPEVLPDSEGSVLYLRAFDAEHQSFVTGPKSVLSPYTKQWKAHVPFAKGKWNNTLHLTLEDFLEEPITSQIGPFVGLGNPGDRLPPDGATREYAPDAIWKERFLALARSAKCIVIALGESDNLQWELRQIRENGLCKKLCLFTSPRIVDRERGSLSKALRSEATRRNALASGWATLSETLRRARYDCDPVCPGPGAVITFDENGKNLLLTTEASTPTDYITPVADWFQTGRKSGRWMPVFCGSCQATIYQETGSAASGASLCFSCQGEAELAQMSGIARTFERHPVLESIWGFLSFVITALLATSMSLDSVWLTIILWVAVLAAPWVVVAGFQRVRRARSSEHLTTSSPSMPVQLTVVTPEPLDDSQSR